MTANPLTGPCPKLYKIIPTKSVVTLASIIDVYALLYPLEIAFFKIAPFLNSSLILSKIKASRRR